MGRGDRGAVEARPLEILTDLPPLPLAPPPAPDEALAGEAIAAPGDDTPAAGQELAAALVGLTDALVGWLAFGPDQSRPVAPAAAQERVAQAVARVAGHLGPVAGAAGAVVPAPLADALALAGWAAVAWGGAILAAAQRWRNERAQDRATDGRGREAGNTDRGAADRATPRGAAGAADGGRSAGPPGAGGFDRNGADYHDRLTEALTRPGGTIPGRR